MLKGCINQRTGTSGGGGGEVGKNRSARLNTDVSLNSECI